VVLAIMVVSRLTERLDGVRSEALAAGPADPSAPIETVPAINP
jgi:hypothetical protein